MMFEEGEEEGDYYWFSSIESSKKKKKKMMNKKRFSDEQVRSLESIFENETKLEPKKKMLLAQELGLQPRQVAIWFQNKRARYKSKQLERDYAILRANYNALASKFDSLNKDNQSLLLQVQKLRDMIGDEKKEYKKEEEGKKNSNNNDDESDKPSELSMEGGSMLSDDDGSSETDVLNMVHPVPPDSFTATKPTWMDDLRPDGLFDQAVDSSQWWDFWS